MNLTITTDTLTNWVHQLLPNKDRNDIHRFINSLTEEKLYNIVELSSSSEVNLINLQFSNWYEKYEKQRIEEEDIYKIESAVHNIQQILKEENLYLYAGKNYELYIFYQSRNYRIELPDDELGENKNFSIVKDEE